MSLASSLNTANSIFRNTAQQSSVISTNIANTGNENYVRRDAVVTQTVYGASMVQNERSQQMALLRQMSSSTSQQSAQSTLLDGLTTLSDALAAYDDGDLKAAARGFTASAKRGEALGQFGKDLQVLFGRLLGDQQHEQQGYGLAVGRVEWHRRRQAQKSAACLLEALDAAVRNGDALAESGRSQLLACEEAVEDRSAGNSVVVLEEQAGLLEDPFLAAGFKVEQDVVCRQEFGK